MRTVVIMTAIPIETREVLQYLRDRDEEVVRGAVFHTGFFDGETGPWRVIVGQPGAGNIPATLMMDRAINRFKPDVALFVGVAGGIKDVRIGDVVVGTKIYGYESGKVEEGAFRARPEVFRCSDALVSRARAVLQKGTWIGRFHYRVPRDGRRAFIGPIATGDKVIATVEDRLHWFLRETYNDALAVEMEGRGFAEALHGNPEVAGLVVRGISDLLSGKSASDAVGNQELAADAAAAFAFEVLSTFRGDAGRDQSTEVSAKPVATAVMPASAPDFIGLPHHTWNRHQSPPGALLRADYGVVPFHGRDRELADLARWCDDPDLPVGVRLYTGAGGMGKTRLLLEVCQRRREAGWLAGFVDTKAAPRERGGWTNVITPAQPIFLVVDYAETNQDLLFTLLSSVARRTDAYVRIVLLARGPGDWWDILKGREDGVGDLLSGPSSRWLPLKPLAFATEERQYSYRAALDSFAHVLVKPQPVDSAGIDFDDPVFERVLLLHMTALASIDGIVVKGEDGVLNYVLRRERRFWQDLTEKAELPQMLSDGISQAMAVLTLAGGAPNRPTAVDMLRKVPLLRGQPPAVLWSITNILHTAYPGDQFIEPLLPDLLGEHLVERELDREGQMDEIFDIVFGPKG
jgi:nucleoside phosphorylase